MVVAVREEKDSVLEAYSKGMNRRHVKSIVVYLFYSGSSTILQVVVIIVYSFLLV